MAHEVSVGVSSAWKRIRPWWVGSSSAWKQILKGHIGVSGAWKQFYGNIPSNLIAFFTASPSSPWNSLSYTDVFPAGYSALGGTIGADTHHHDAQWGTIGNAIDTYPGDTSALYHPVMLIHGSGHTKSHSHGETSHVPIYQEWRMANANGADCIPTGAILLFAGSSIPSGWSRATYTSGRYLRVNSSGAGGLSSSSLATHTHTHPSTDTTYGSGNRQYLVGSNPHHQDPDNHSHTVPDHTAKANDPMSVQLDMITPNSNVYVIPKDTVAFFSDSTLPPGWTLYSNGIENDGRIVKLGTSVGTKAGQNYHYHQEDLITGYFYGTARQAAADGTTVCDYGHRHYMTHTHMDGGSEQDSLPLCQRFLMGIKD